MTLHQFENEKTFNEHAHLFTVEQKGVMYVRAEDPRHPIYGIPVELRTFSDIYYWEVGNVGKILWLGSIKAR